MKKVLLKCPECGKPLEVYSIYEEREEVYLSDKGYLITDSEYDPYFINTKWLAYNINCSVCSYHATVDEGELQRYADYRFEI